jgi:hypothetical protein
MENSSFNLNYFLPAITEQNVGIFLFIIFVLILLFPRIYMFVTNRFNPKFSTSSKYSDFLNNIEFIKEDGILRKFYSFLHGDSSSNNNRILILKLSTLYVVLIIVIAMIFPIGGSIYSFSESTLASKIVLIFLFSIPIIFISLHLIEIRHHLFPVFLVIYSFVFYLLLISTYLMFFLFLLYIGLRFAFKLAIWMLQRIRVVVRI